MKNASNDDLRAIGRRRAPPPAIGTSTFSNFASCTFFSITRFEPFSLITRSSFGRLNAAVCTPRLPSPAAKTTLTTRIGASAPSFGLRYFGSIGSAFSSPCSSAPNDRQLLRLGVVAQRDERFERGLVAEPLVLVGLVRADRRLDRRIELHPRHVAREVVVREERLARAARGTSSASAASSSRGRLAQVLAAATQRVAGTRRCTAPPSACRRRRGG